MGSRLVSQQDENNFRICFAVPQFLPRIFEATIHILCALPIILPTLQTRESWRDTLSLPQILTRWPAGYCKGACCWWNCTYGLQTQPQNHTHWMDINTIAQHPTQPVPITRGLTHKHDCPHGPDEVISTMNYAEGPPLWTKQLILQDDRLVFTLKLNPGQTWFLFKDGQAFPWMDRYDSQTFTQYSHQIL